MTTYARIVDGCAIDVTTSDPKTIFHPEVASQLVMVPDGTSNGDRKNGNTWTKFVPPQEVVPAVKAPVVTPPQFKMLIMGELAEIMGEAKDDIVIGSFMEIVNDPRLTEVDLGLTSVQNGLKYCLKKIGRSDDQISQRMAEILSGVLT